MTSIIYDATVLVDGNDMIEERRGVYFVARNLLLEMCRHSQSEIYLFASTYKEAGLQQVIADLNLAAKPYKKVSFCSKRMHSIVLFCRRKRLESKGSFSKRFFFSVLLFVLSLFSTILYSLINFNYKINSDCVFFSPRTSAPWFINRRKDVRKYIVLHDLIPILQKNREMLWWGWFAYLIRTLNCNDMYFAVSESAKRDFCNYFKNLKESHVKIAYCACDDSFFPHSDSEEKENLKERYKIPKSKKFILAMGAQDPKKNAKRIIRSFLAFQKKNQVTDLVLVVTGCQENRDEGLVLCRSYVSRADLPLFYSYAEWLVFTSQYEGFGLPPLEAMQCGCPVIASNNSSIPEVVGDAGLLIDWNSDEQHISAFEKYYFDEELRAEKRNRGLIQAKKFSWEETTKKILAEMSGK